MKIIKFDSKNPNSENLYRVLDPILEFGMNYLPFIFLQKKYLDGYPVHIPRWITQKRMDQIDKKVQDLMKNLKWDE